MKYYVTGDKHGDFHTILQDGLVKDANNAIIILGDAGFNFFLNKNDVKLKESVSENSSCTWYCVRGNHEARPEDVEGMDFVYDEKIKGNVLMQPEFPTIKYLCDGASYWMNQYRIAVIGGAYSVDKWWRLNRAGIYSKQDFGYFKPKRSGWFWNEQLDEDEMQKVYQNLGGGCYNFVFSHTCPYSWQPTDLFLNAVDQSSVDNSMEVWLDFMKREMVWDHWLFGHYHADRIERPHVEQYYRDIEGLDDIVIRWEDWDDTQELDWWLSVSPNFMKESSHD